MTRFKCYAGCSNCTVCLKKKLELSLTSTESFKLTLFPIIQLVNKRAGEHHDVTSDLSSFFSLLVSNFFFIKNAVTTVIRDTIMTLHIHKMYR